VTVLYKFGSDERTAENKEPGTLKCENTLLFLVIRTSGFDSR